MTILITGAGIIGTLAARKLVDMGEMPILYEIAPQMANITLYVDINKVRLIRGDILDFPDLLRIIKNEGVDRIIHTASFLTTAVRERPYAGVKTNLLGTMNILEAARLMDIQRVVFCSSNTVQMGTYWQTSTIPYIEDFPMTAINGRPRSVYGILKLATEWIGLDYFERFGVDFLAMRFAGVFGPWKGTPAGLPTRMMKEFIEKPLAGHPVTIDDPTLTWSGLEELVYAKDAANSAVLACYANNPISRIYNITMGRAYQFDELLRIVRKRFPSIKIEVTKINPGATGGYPYKREQPTDISRARSELGYEPEFDTFEKAIEDYVEWIKINGF
jgi:nucleoside-diphosphate-sugar epimerase